MVAYTDAAFADNLEDRKSTQGFVLHLFWRPCILPFGETEYSHNVFLVPDGERDDGVPTLSLDSPGSQFDLQWKATNNMMADGLTKALGKQKLDEFVKMLRLEMRPSPARVTELAAQRPIPTLPATLNDEGVGWPEQPKFGPADEPLAPWQSGTAPVPAS
ncbi:hypothetical protein MY3296_007856 [Beauveria thailandica]